MRLVLLFSTRGAVLLAAILAAPTCFALEAAKGAETMAEECARVRSNAEEIMGYRQERRSVLDVLAMVEATWPNHASPYWERAVTDAYEVPAFENEPYRGRAIADFGEKHELMCVKDARSKEPSTSVPNCDQISKAILNRAYTLAAEQGWDLPMSRQKADDDLFPLLIADPITFALMMSVNDECPAAAPDPKLIRPD